MTSAQKANISQILQDEIESGLHAPGSPLDERSLAERFGVSRTPIREALQQLAVRELVEITPRQGACVARLTVGRLRAILEFIAEGEAICAKLAATRVDDALMARLEQAMKVGKQALAKAGTGAGAAAYLHANGQFHQVIYEGSRNAYLSEQVRAARRMIQRYRVKDFQSRRQIEQSLKEHERIVRAIGAGDGGAAYQAMLDHIPAGGVGFSEFLVNLPMNFFEDKV